MESQRGNKNDENNKNIPAKIVKDYMLQLENGGDTFIFDAKLEGNDLFLLTNQGVYMLDMTQYKETIIIKKIFKYEDRQKVLRNLTVYKQNSNTYIVAFIEGYYKQTIDGFEQEQQKLKILEVSKKKIEDKKEDPIENEYDIVKNVFIECFDIKNNFIVIFFNYENKKYCLSGNLDNVLLQDSNKTIDNYITEIQMTEMQQIIYNKLFISKIQYDDQFNLNELVFTLFSYDGAFIQIEINNIDRFCNIKPYIYNNQIQQSLNYNQLNQLQKLNNVIQYDDQSYYIVFQNDILILNTEGKNVICTQLQIDLNQLFNYKQNQKIQIQIKDLNFINVILTQDDFNLFLAQIDNKTLLFQQTSKEVSKNSILILK